jgi:hypothetical protein
MRRERVGVVAWQAESCGSVADNAADPLDYPLSYSLISHVLKELSWYNSVKSPHHVK